MVREYTLYDLYLFRFVETCFMAYQKSVTVPSVLENNVFSLTSYN